MKFSIITPTIQRESLVSCCRSVDEQSYTDWEHIVFIDAPLPREELIDSLCSPQRKFLCEGKKFGNYGNHARHQACAKATGDYFIWLDDDNILTGNALQNISECLAERPLWAVFPIQRHGWWFFNDPPGMCMTDSANIVVQREIGAWPDIEAREADGVLAERLKAYPYGSFPLCPPIILMEKSSNGI